MEGLLPDPVDFQTLQQRETAHRSRAHGLPSWLSASAWSHRAPKTPKPEDSATQEQKDALAEYRHALRIRPHSWAWLPLDRPLSQLAGGDAQSDNAEEKERAEMAAKIWEDLLSERRDPPHLRRPLLHGAGIAAAHALRDHGAAQGPLQWAARRLAQVAGSDAAHVHHVVQHGGGRVTANAGGHEHIDAHEVQMHLDAVQQQQEDLLKAGSWREAARADAEDASVNAARHAGAEAQTGAHAVDSEGEQLVAEAQRKAEAVRGGDAADVAAADDHSTLTFDRSDLVCGARPGGPAAGRTGRRYAHAKCGLLACSECPQTCMVVAHLRRADHCHAGRFSYWTDERTTGGLCDAAPRGNASTTNLWSILGAEQPSVTDNRPYNIDWPFDFCNETRCPDDDDADSSGPVAAVAAANGAQNTTKPPWSRWSINKQAKYLIRLFPLPGSRLINIVTDECMLKSVLTAYGLLAPEWQSEGGSSHVDWGRADAHGHPGSYSQAAVRLFPDGVRAVRRFPPDRQLSHANCAVLHFLCTSEYLRADVRTRACKSNHQALLEQDVCMQRVREGHCDKLVNATYRSAQMILTRDAVPHVSWIPETFGAYHHLWQFSPMPDTCVLFARKFEPGTEAEESFFRSCSHIGLNASCITEAHMTSHYGDAHATMMPTASAAVAAIMTCSSRVHWSTARVPEADWLAHDAVAVAEASSGLTTTMCAANDAGCAHRFA